MMEQPSGYECELLINGRENVCQNDDRDSDSSSKIFEEEAQIPNSRSPIPDLAGNRGFPPGIGKLEIPNSPLGWIGPRIAP